MSSQSFDTPQVAAFLVEGVVRSLTLAELNRFPNSLLSDICRQCPECLNGAPVSLTRSLVLFDWVIEIYKGREHLSPLPSVPVAEINAELDFFRLPHCSELQLYKRADWHRKRRLDCIRSIIVQILELLSNSFALKSSFEFLLFWNQCQIWTEDVKVELLWNHTEPEYYTESTAIMNVLFKSGFVRPWTCTKVFTSNEHLFMENKPKNWSMGFPILTGVTLEEFNIELKVYGFTISQECSQVCIGSDSFVKEVSIPYVRLSY
eukprot:g3209.t1